MRKVLDIKGNIFYSNEQGEYHRDDGPAIEFYNGIKYWLINGLRHREDGPAVEWADGYKSWYINGQRLTEEEFNAYKKRLTMKKILGIV